MPVAAAERLSAGLPAPTIAALRVAETVSAGSHGLRRPGPGYDFWQFRLYRPGDPVRAVDWRRSARDGRVLISERERDAAQTFWLWEDRSASMDWRGARTRETKADRARLLILAAATLLMRAGHQVAPIGPAPGRYRHERRLAELSLALDRAPPIAGLPRNLGFGKYAQALLVGDFLDSAGTIEPLFRRLADAGVRGHIVQVLDPAETGLPMRGRRRFVGLEGEGELLVRRVGGLRAAYRERLDAHNEALRGRAAQLGWTVLRHVTDAPPVSALLALVGQLSERPDRLC